jgi:hypothetical protein
MSQRVFHVKRRSKALGLGPRFTHPHLITTLVVFAPVTNTSRSPALMTLPEDPEYKPKKVATAATVTTLYFNSI